ncbi:unnamed protein product [Trypanosoma congolense IL3000]|uniref:WGS project CAEQ00000000 data, annotated contig 2454 n=1 Tax=Trypanosoma congolense (strain IL3000) TaxID=1068625 RepID=F9WEB6_TRYCI|nr:unnamed protein product [Trypanosoma congolense IL3000]
MGYTGCYAQVARARASWPGTVPVRTQVWGRESSPETRPLGQTVTGHCAADCLHGTNIGAMFRSACGQYWAPFGTGITDFAWRVRVRKLMWDTDCLEQEQLKGIQGGAVWENIRRCAKVLRESTCDGGEAPKCILVSRLDTSKSKKSVQAPLILRQR